MHTQAVEELNIKSKYWKDLMDDTPFTRKDIIHLQDPLNLEASISSEAQMPKLTTYRFSIPGTPLQRFQQQTLRRLVTDRGAVRVYSHHWERVQRTSTIQAGQGT